MKTLTQFFSGLVATVILLTGFGVLPAYAQIAIPQTCPNGDCPVIGTDVPTDVDEGDVADFIIGVAQAFTFIVIALSVLFLVYGGFKFVTDNGDGKGAEAGKSILLNAVIGLVLSIVAFAIVQVIAQVVSGDIAGNFV